MSIDTKEIYYFEFWYKNRFCFTNANGNKLSFCAEYRSSIAPKMTIDQVVIEDCEDVMLDGKEIVIRK